MQPEQDMATTNSWDDKSIADGKAMIRRRLGPFTNHQANSYLCILNEDMVVASSEHLGSNFSEDVGGGGGSIGQFAT